MPGRTRRPTADAAERMTQVVAMRRQRMTQDQIAKRLGIACVSVIVWRPKSRLKNCSPPRGFICTRRQLMKSCCKGVRENC